MTKFDSIFNEHSFESEMSMHDTYCDLISACCDEQTAQRCIAWLDRTDFFVAPASTKYHDAHRCGLVKHTLLVAKVMLDIAKLPQFSGINITEAILTSLVHDWCKINFYEEYTRNVKDQDTGTWFEQKAYRCKGSQIPLGHGVTSLYMSMRFFRISVEQALAIRWHMSDYTASEHEKYDLMEANNRPMVQMLQIADRMASTLYT